MDNDARNSLSRNSRISYRELRRSSARNAQRERSACNKVQYRRFIATVLKDTGDYHIRIHHYFGHLLERPTTLPAISRLA